MSSTTSQPDAIPAHRELAEVNPPISYLEAPWQLVLNVRKHYQLVANFVSRDLQLKYRDSAFGYLWSLLEPLLLSGVYFLLYVIIGHSEHKELPLWIILGVISWGFFNRALNGSLTSLTKNEAMIKQVYFPREIFAITTVWSQMVIAMLSLLVAVPMLFYFHMVPDYLHLVMVPIALIMLALLALGVGLAGACLNVVNRDIEHLFQFLTRAGLFISPVMWTIQMAPKSRGPILHYLMWNPTVVPLEMVRSGITGTPLLIPPFFIAYSAACCVLAFVVGAMIFKRNEARVVKKL